MDKTTVIVSAVAGFLGVLSAILGFAAEAAKHSDCASALGMVVAASVFMMMAKVTVAAGGGCRKSRAIVPSVTKRTIGVTCAAISWIAAVMAFVMFLDTGGISVDHGSSKSAAAELGICAAIFLMVTHVAMAAAGCCCRSCCIPSETARVVCAVASWIVPVIVFVLLLHAAIEESDCDKIHEGVYAVAGVLVLISTVLGITSYLMLRTRPAPEDDEPGQIVVPMVIAFQPVYPNPLLVPVPAQGIGAGQAPPPNQPFAHHPATLPPQGGWYGQAPNQQFAAPAPAPAQGYGWQPQAPNQQYFPCAGVAP